ncbi:hypothetical protein ABZ318_02220 [Streptomyces sp. NPDC006197]|uniref:hypothetical protein n=1 Tax=Streptomyces sp. NPDC006197 TaxID=3156685 RepID=UPI0033A6CE7F
MSDRTEGRTTARMLRVSTLALCLEAGVAVAALLTRPARRGYFVALLLWGTLAVVSAFLLGGVVLSVQE